MFTLMTLAVLGGCTEAATVEPVYTDHCKMDNGIITRCDEGNL